MHHSIRVEISESPCKIRELYPKALGHMEAAKDERSDVFRSMTYI